MAEVAIAVQRVLPTGVAPTYTGSLLTTNTYLVRNSGRVMLHFKKAGASVCTVTIQTPATVGGLAVAEQTNTVPASTGDIMAGPFPPRIYNDGAGDLRFTLSEITGLTVAVVEM
jgi:hypothetical protein